LIGQSRVGFLRDFCFIWLASLLGHRAVTHLHGGNYASFYASQPPWLQWLIKKTLARVDKLIVLSASLESCFDFLGSGREKTTVVPNGLPFELLESATPVSLQPGQPIRVLYLSNMIEAKGYWQVLEACRILKKQGVPFRCEFCGEFISASDDQLYHSAAEARQAFLRAVEEWQLEKEVKWWGVARGEEKSLQLRRAHCFVLPTRYGNEGQPVSIIEALAFGKVIIATQYRAIPDMLSEGYNGFFVDSDSPEQIAERVEWLWRNPGELTRMSLDSLARYRQSFTREEHVSRLMSVLCDGSLSRSDDCGSGEIHLPDRA
jgi:glycosyltransferase involved in cell wall biosynthesis